MYFSAKTLILALFLLFSAGPAAAKTFAAETFTLANGLQVVVIPNHRAPVVTHMVWYKFGAADERQGKSGIAHFLEHLMFKGTEKVPDGQFSLRVKKMGGQDNAFTTHDYTAYYQNISLERLPQVMEMEADRMENLVLKESQIAPEREVIIEERRQRIDNQPQARFREQLMSALFVNHPYATPVIGWLHEMKELTREDALDNYGAWYAPNNAILVVAGDIDAKKLKPLAEKYYGALNPALIEPRQRPLPAPIIAQHRIIMEDVRAGQPLITRVWRAPRGSDALEILAEFFGGSSSARLYKSLVVDQRLAVSAGADYDPISLNDSTFTVYARPIPGTSMTKLEIALDEEIRKLVYGGVMPEELKNAKSKKKAETTYYLDSLQGPALLFGRVLASGFNIDYIDNWEERIDRLSSADVNATIKAMFSAENLPVTGILLPREKK